MLKLALRPLIMTQLKSSFFILSLRSINYNAYYQTTIGTILQSTFVIYSIFYSQFLLAKLYNNQSSNLAYHHIHEEDLSLMFLLFLLTFIQFMLSAVSRKELDLNLYILYASTLYNSFIMDNHKTNSSEFLIYNWEALKLFLPYLKLSDLLPTVTVSKQWQYHLNQYLKKFILPQPYSENSTDALQAAKQVFDRNIILKQLNETKIIQFPEICCKVQFGNHTVKLETLQGNTYITKNDKLVTLTKKDWNNSTLVYKLQPKFTSARCIGSFLYLIGDSHVVRYITSNENIFNQQLVIQFQHGIQHFIASNSAALVVLSSTSKISQYIFLSHKDGKSKRVTFPFAVQNPFTDIFLDYGTHGFILSTEGKLYEINFNEAEVVASECKLFKQKRIQKIKGGNKHYFAYERKVKRIKDWENTEVLSWAEKEGFDDYLKIFRSEKVTGEKLLTMDKTYMEDVLGILNTLIQQKMRLLISDLNKLTVDFEDYIVYSWGKNDRGQLCSNPSANISNPIKLKLPENVQIYTCFGDQTILYNKKSHQISINGLDQQGKLKWQTVTNNKVWTIAGHKGALIYCESKGKKRIPQSMSEQPLNSKKQKLRTAKNIIDQIQWDSNLDANEFRVGYTNRFSGTLQCTFSQFVKSDIKQNSVLYFKRGEKVVWDKKLRLDIL